MNWQYDGRRDVLESTKAATYFLSDMHRHFKGNWLLAIASYNTGAGNVERQLIELTTFPLNHHIGT